MRSFVTVYLPMLLLMVCQVLEGQSREGFSGTEFWVTFGSNVVIQNDTNLHVVIVSSTNDTVELKNPITGVTRVYQVQANVLKRASFSKKEVWQCWSKNADQPVPVPEACAVRIRSKRAIQVFAANPISISNDNTSILPVEYLESGQDYIVSSSEANAGRGGQIAIVALDAGITKVRIKTKVDLQGALGRNFTEDIPYAHAYMIGTDRAVGSLAGTSIQVEGSCNRIAVFTGIKCAENGNSPGCNSCDLMMEQAWPSIFFEKEFVIPSVPDNNGYSIQLVAKFNNTDVLLDGLPLTTLQENEVYDFDQSGSADHYLSANNPIGVTQMAKGFGCSGHPQNSGDPSLLNIATVKNGVKEAYLALYDDAVYTHYAKLVVQSNAAPKININGTAMAPVGGYKTYSFGGQSYYVGYVELPSRKSYHFTSDKEFQGYYYGMGSKQGISTCFAAAFVNRNANISLSPNYVCDTSEKFSFSAIGDSVSNILWQFGDGQISNKNPESHSYRKTGTFNVQLIRYRSSGFCKADTIEKDVFVYKRPDPVLPADTMPCVGEFYKLTLPDLSGVSYLWSDGGASRDRTFSKSEDLKLIITDSNGCVSNDSVSIQFKDCDFQSLKIANVFTPNKDGKNDRWRVINEGYETVHVYIYNRWGELMYSYDAVTEEHWNGTLANQGFTQCTDGVYFYQIVAYNAFTKSDKTMSGTVLLIR
ncbi:gliding motility-associated C-terminal domain-containing protein [Bacteroidia bacterium]|nr:gliding motility-associated C-terminal domain-containing protein [Bacteroidia bacterium]